MGDKPHEIYTDAEKKARAERVCGNCKHWGRDFEFDGIGLCFNEQSHSQVKTSIYLPEQGRKDDPTLYKHLHTKPDFGCIHFEPKTKP